MYSVCCITHRVLRLQAEAHKSSQIMRGYIAMLVVDTRFRGAGIGAIPIYVFNLVPFRQLAD